MDEEPIKQQIKISIYTPLVYVGILLAAFMIFAYKYKQRKITKFAEMESLFPPNLCKDMYLHLKAQEDPKPHDRVLKAALLRRGVEAIRRSLKLKESQNAFKNLYQQGLIGDDLYENYELSSKVVELEIREIAIEAETIKKGWAQSFFPVAQEICFNEALRRRLKAMDERADKLSELWHLYVEKSEAV